MSSSPYKPRPPFSEDDLVEMEKKIRRRLPDAYRKFAKEYGGAIILGEGDAADDVDILSFYGPEDYTGPNSLFVTYDDLAEIGALPIARCVYGNPHVITSDDKIFYVDFSGGQTSSEKEADSFQEFLDKISKRKIGDVEGP
jgi:hypothetical protein